MGSNRRRVGRKARSGGDEAAAADPDGRPKEEIRHAIRTPSNFGSSGLTRGSSSSEVRRPASAAAQPGIYLPLPGANRAGASQPTGTKSTRPTADAGADAAATTRRTLCVAGDFSNKPAFESTSCTVCISGKGTRASIIATAAAIGTETCCPARRCFSVLRFRVRASSCRCDGAWSLADRRRCPTGSTFAAQGSGRQAWESGDTAQRPTTTARTRTRTCQARTRDNATVRPILHISAVPHSSHRADGPPTTA